MKSGVVTPAAGRFMRSPGTFLVILLLLAVASAFVAVFVGRMGPIGAGDPRWIPFSDALDAILGLRQDSVFYESNRAIFWDLRIPRVLLAGLVGAALACAGTAMQGVFRNSMADPFIIGVSSGAALGGVAAELTGIGAVIAISSPALAFVAALITVFVVYSLGTVRGRVYVDTLLLSGVAVAAFLGAVVSFLIYMARVDYHKLIPWLLGSFSASTWTQVWIVLVPVFAGVVIVFYFGRGLDALLLGEETAHNLGADPEFLKKIMLVTAALMTAGAVAFVGIVGFVGLIVPHMMRILVGAPHRILVPAATLFGASFLIWADALSRTVVPGEELPVGVITALCGGPFFLYLLRRSRTSGGSI